MLIFCRRRLRHKEKLLRGTSRHLSYEGLSTIFSIITRSLAHIMCRQSLSVCQQSLKRNVYVLLFRWLFALSPVHTERVIDARRHDHIYEYYLTRVSEP